MRSSTVTPLETPPEQDDATPTPRRRPVVLPRALPQYLVDLATAPDILTIDEVALIYRTTAKSLREQIWNNTCRPLPIAIDPYRWWKVDILHDIELRAREAPSLVRDRQAERSKKRLRRRRRSA